eukprot:CAMPEP_0168423802 /NCGR_PEP_ID=MMETSP0228-20121227/34496_1 /TAXON_ID=133427 /ORGANISM="Protoceratium reticulatum, Strain CCCM 535 (=CCMP 1889)" /LENGTH=626 /DNA_ID=CAMNT_0008437775 /DNA_START=65 /DNA_END=1945 /DNA_ORIENTATION=-
MSRRAVAVMPCLLLSVYGDPVWNLNMYRALTKTKNQKQSPPSNANAADIVGVLRYLHQEVIPEHSQADLEREARKYEINAIARFGMKVKNPDGLQASGVPGFGIYGAFDFGVMTTPPVLNDLVKVGDYVGISVENSPQLKYAHPWYWFSISGFCPNLPWKCIEPFPNCENPDPPTIPAPCLGMGCGAKSAGKSCSKDPTFADPSNGELVIKCCLHYASEEDTDVIKGGLCEEEVEEPTGEHGCTYKVVLPQRDEDYALLDAVAGITDMECTDGSTAGSTPRPCKDWLDWRQKCVDPTGTYKKRFVCKGACNEDPSPVIESTSYCIEYDLHPFCQDSSKLCDDPRCQALAPEDRELGLPFWKGKCDAEANSRRAEAFVLHFLGPAVEGTHRLTDSKVDADNPACHTDPICTPNPNGGPYCTKAFAGICSRCYIPGTLPAFSVEDAKVTPVCPFDIFSETTAQPNTQCKSKSAKDLCCLYKPLGFSCETADDELDAYLISASKRDTEVMYQFLKEFAESNHGEVVDEQGLKKLAYWSWGAQPPVQPEEAWEAVQSKLRSDPSVRFSETTTTTTVPEAPKLFHGRVLKYVALAVIMAASAGGIAFLAYHHFRGEVRRPANVREAELSRM